MPDLNFQVEGVEPQRFAAEPALRFRLLVSEATPPGALPTPIHAVALRCQIRIEPARRRYEDGERERLLDLFGTPERWGQTLRAIPWTDVGAVVPSFTGEGGFDLPVPCSFDFNLAATKYFTAIEAGDLPLGFLFSGTIFYESAEGALQISQVSWDKEANFRLPSTAWRELRDTYYPDGAYLGLRRDVLDRLDGYKARNNLPTYDGALERLLQGAEARGPASP